MTVATNNPVSKKPTYDKNLAGLHQPEGAVEILGKQVRFVAPNFLQIGRLMQWQLKSGSRILGEDLVFTSENLQKAIVATQVAIQSDENQFPVMMLDQDLTEDLLKVMRCCFPDLDCDRITTEAFFACLGVLFSATESFNL